MSKITTMDKLRNIIAMNNFNIIASDAIRATINRECYVITINKIIAMISFNESNLTFK
nr:MAG TPA: hypothetical protein [Caudoviricetes sp.]